MEPPSAQLCFPAAPFPRSAAAMTEWLRTHFGGALPVQCIVNEYRPGQGIGMHAEHLDFGPVVASLSLGAAGPMRFRRRDAPPGIDRADTARETTTRVSATFRTLAE